MQGVAGARLSPNGQWLAYTSDETRRFEIYVQAFPKPAGKWQVSTNGGGLPHWSADGKELFFTAANHKLMAVPVKAGSTFEAGVPKVLFEVPRGWFDVSKDGRFLVSMPVEQSAIVQIAVVLNWTAGLKR